MLQLGYRQMDHREINELMYKDDMTIILMEETNSYRNKNKIIKNSRKNGHNI